MKRNFWREMALLSAPLLIVGSLWGWSAWQKRRRTPTVTMTVSVAQDASVLGETLSSYAPQFGHQLTWNVKLAGGPRNNYRLGWNEQLVARTSRGPVIVWKRDQPTGLWQTQTRDGAPRLKGKWRTDAQIADEISGTYASNFSAGAGLNSAWMNGINLWREPWPADTQSVEWRAQFVAIPSDSDQLWYSPVPAATLREWAKIEGAATWKRAISLKIKPRNFAPVLLWKQKTSPLSLYTKGYVDVGVRTHFGNWRTLRRLTGFNGKMRRTLWTSADKGGNLYYRGGGSSSGTRLMRQGDIYTFDMGEIPPAWGEVTFLCDTVFVFDPQAPVRAWSNLQLDPNALTQFEKRWNGYRASDRLVLRADKKAPR